MAPVPDDPTMAQAWISGVAPDQTVDFYIPRGNQGIQGPPGNIGPSLAVGTIETVTGPAAPGTVGAQGIQGLKGDPGGLVAATSLAGSPNLNDVVTPGTYRNTDNTNATTALNFPLNGVAANIIVVATGPSIVTQMLYPINGAYASRMFWVRSYNATWSPWRAYNSTRVDVSAGRAFYQWNDNTNVEQLVYGDTGYRDIIASNGGNGTFAALKVRRVLSTVEIIGVAWTPNLSGTVSPFAVNLPVGFRSAHTTVLPAIQANLPIGGTISNVGGGALNSITSGASVSFFVQYTTPDAWPTTLPGIASGSIPNL